MQKKLFLIATLLIVVFGGAAATNYVIDSNKTHIVWSLSCGSGTTVCVFFGSLSGNSTLANYSIRILANQAVSNQYINTTVISTPPEHRLLSQRDPRNTLAERTLQLHR